MLDFKEFPNDYVHSSREAFRRWCDSGTIPVSTGHGWFQTGKDFYYKQYLLNYTYHKALFISAGTRFFDFVKPYNSTQWLKLQGWGMPSHIDGE